MSQSTEAVGPSPPAGECPDVELRSLVKTFGSTVAVDSLDLRLPRGELVAVLGPTGCGKTSVLRMIGGLERPTSGQVLLRGKDVSGVPPHRRGVGLVFQDYALFPHMTVFDNVAFGLRMARKATDTIRAAVTDALNMVRLPDIGERFPRELSGGMRQRVALARAIVVRPTVLLLDEPLGALDRSMRELMQVELRALQRQIGITTLLVTHDQEEALSLADSVAVMRSGRIEQFSTPAELYNRPVNEFVATFLGAANIFSGKLEAGDGSDRQLICEDGTVIQVPFDAEPRMKGISVCIRPERILLESRPDRPLQGPNRLSGVVENFTFHGRTTIYRIRVNSERSITVSVGGSYESDVGRQYAAGDNVVISWSPDAVHRLAG